VTMTATEPTMKPSISRITNRFRLRELISPSRRPF
jgi:hypothetical protein